MLAAALTLVLVAGIWPPAAAATGNLHARADAPTWQRQMLRLVNAERTRLGLRSVILCAPLARASSTYARVMASTGHFDHVGPDGSDPWDRGRAEGYDYRRYSENIAAGQRSVAEVVRAWFDSPGHYRNIIDPRIRHAGFGHATSADSEMPDYWVQNFGAGGTC